MASVHQSVDIDTLVQVAYHQWLRFEDFAHFMESVEEVRRVGDKRLHWRGTIGGKAMEWDIEITEQVPERLIAWRNPKFPENHGVIVFEPLDEGRTHLAIDVEYQPERAEHKIGDFLGLIEAQIQDELEHFKEFIEARGRYTGGPDPNSVSPA
jgi:uncharacterized membrane protein